MYTYIVEARAPMSERVTKNKTIGIVERISKKMEKVIVTIISGDTC